MRVQSNIRERIQKTRDIAMKAIEDSNAVNNFVTRRSPSIGLKGLAPIPSIADMKRSS